MQGHEQELVCDEAYAFLDTCADRVNRGEDVAALMPLVHHHLAMCPDCREEFDALLCSIESTPYASQGRPVCMARRARLRRCWLRANTE